VDLKADDDLLEKVANDDANPSKVKQSVIQLIELAVDSDEYEEFLIKEQLTKVRLAISSSDL
jgi:hypothetical protein